MPQPRKHASDAARQAAFRRRAEQNRNDALLAKGLPPLPKITTIPGWARWRAAAQQGRLLLQSILDEMDDYHDKRSEEWHETERAERLAQAREEILQIIEQVEQLDLGKQ